jgi:hypothetical protein
MHRKNIFNNDTINTEGRQGKKKQDPFAYPIFFFALSSLAFRVVIKIFFPEQPPKKGPEDVAASSVAKKGRGMGVKERMVHNKILQDSTEKQRGTPDLLFC